jgi:hypothetical protein
VLLLSAITFPLASPIASAAHGTSMFYSAVDAKDRPCASRAPCIDPLKLRFLPQNPRSEKTL